MPVAVDLTRMLTVGPNVTVYVVDSHRPYNLVNIYVAKHVRGRATHPTGSPMVYALLNCHPIRPSLVGGRKRLRPRQVFVVDDDDIEMRMKPLEVEFVRALAPSDGGARRGRRRRGR